MKGEPYALTRGAMRRFLFRGNILLVLVEAHNRLERDFSNPIFMGFEKIIVSSYLECPST
jgi:hypothetical protein